jgi:hypothetical protein
MYQDDHFSESHPNVPEIDLNEIENLKNVLKPWTLFTVGLNLDNFSLRT